MAAVYYSYCFDPVYLSNLIAIAADLLLIDHHRGTEWSADLHNRHNRIINIQLHLIQTERRAERYLLDRDILRELTTILEQRNNELKQHTEGV